MRQERKQAVELTKEQQAAVDLKRCQLCHRGQTVCTRESEREGTVCQQCPDEAVCPVAKLKLPALRAKLLRYHPEIKLAEQQAKAEADLKALEAEMAQEVPGLLLLSSRSELCLSTRSRKSSMPSTALRPAIQPRCSSYKLFLLTGNSRESRLRLYPNRCVVQARWWCSNVRLSGAGSTRGARCPGSCQQRPLG